MASRPGWHGSLEQIDTYRWRIPRSYKPEMRTDGIIYASAQMLERIKGDNSLEQVANVACLPGIVGPSIAMPDIHLGYGFPIGGICATDPEDGVISPGGVGYDINCGVRLLRTDLSEPQVREKLKGVVDQLFRDVPSGVGSEGRLRVAAGEFSQVLVGGARWAVEHGYGWPEDLEAIEDGGAIADANPDAVSSRAVQRGRPQMGTLGSGNHFVEVQAVDEIYDEATARAFGITAVGQVTVMIHCGSRGFGHQVCDDALEVMRRAVPKYGITLPDQQLACCPIQSPEGQSYIGGMRAAANYAFANRQVISHWVREAIAKVFSSDARTLGIQVLYDVAHNIAKFEHYRANGEARVICVHRKGATRALPSGDERVPARYRAVGQPVLIPGDMGRASFLLVGLPGSVAETFGSTCHGAGRTMSRKGAIRAAQAKGRHIDRELAERGIIVRAQNRRLLAEEMSDAYKNVAEVVEVCEGAGISKRVARLRPLGVIKG